MIYAAGCFVVMIIGFAITPTAKETAGSELQPAKTNDASTQNTLNKQKKADAEARKKAEEEAAAKKKAEEAAATAKQKAEAEAAAKKAAEEEAKKIKTGMYEVGKDIQPGLYKSYGDISYWARLKGFTGDLGDILANGNPQGSDIVEVLSTDKGFESNGDGYWIKIDNTYNPKLQTSFGDGTYLVGKDIAPGKYKSEGGSTGYWARLKGFVGGIDGILANGNPEGPTIVTILPTDKGFQTWGNGNWTKIQ